VANPIDIKLGRLPEETDERRMFDQVTKNVYGGDPLLAVVDALEVMHKTAPPQGSLSTLYAIMRNEVAAVIESRRSAGTSNNSMAPLPTEVQARDGL
jgi:hypothetical protein